MKIVMSAFFPFNNSNTDDVFCGHTDNYYYYQLINYNNNQTKKHLSDGDGFDGFHTVKHLETQSLEVIRFAQCELLQPAQP